MPVKIKEKVLVFIGLVIMIVAVFFYASPYITTRTITKDDDVPAGLTLTLTWHLEKSERIEGYFTVRGGNDDVKFHIKDPYGVIIHDAGMVTGRHDFAFTAEHSGVYTLYFDNSFSVITTKIIFLSYQVTVRSILWDLSLPMVIVGILFLAAGLLSLYQERMKEKTQTPVAN